MKKPSIQQCLFAAYKCPSQPSIEFDEGQLAVSSTRLRSFSRNVAYIQLWLFAMRHQSDLASTCLQALPKKELGQPRPGFRAENPVVQSHFAKFALELGFCTPKILELSSQNYDEVIAERTVDQARPYQLYGLDTNTTHQAAAQIADVLASLKCCSRDPVVCEPQWVGPESDDMRERRCGRPYENDLKSDVPFLFFPYLCREIVEPEIGPDISSLYVRRDLVHSFLGQEAYYSETDVPSEQDPESMNVDDEVRPTDHQSVVMADSQQDIVIMTARAEEAERLLAESRRTLENMAAQGREVQCRAERAEASLAQSQQAVISVTARAEQAEKSAEEGQQALVCQTAEQAERSLTDLQQAVASMTARAEQAERSFAESQQVVVNVTARAEQAERSLAESQQSLTCVTPEQAQRSLTDHQQAVASMTARAEQAERSFAESQQVVVNVTARAEQAERSLAESQQSLTCVTPEQAQRSLTDHQQAVASMTARAEQAERSFAESQQVVVNVTARAEQAERSLAESQQCAVNLEVQRQEAQARAERANMCLTESQQAMASMTARAEQAEKSLNKTEQATHSLRTRAEQAEGQLQQIKEKVAGFEKLIAQRTEQAEIQLQQNQRHVARLEEQIAQRDRVIADGSEFAPSLGNGNKQSAQRGLMGPPKSVTKTSMTRLIKELKEIERQATLEIHVEDSGTSFQFPIDTGVLQQCDVALKRAPSEIKLVTPDGELMSRELLEYTKSYHSLHVVSLDGLRDCLEKLRSSRSSTRKRHFEPEPFQIDIRKAAFDFRKRIKLRTQNQPMSELKLLKGLHDPHLDTTAPIDTALTAQPSEAPCNPHSEMTASVDTALTAQPSEAPCDPNLDTTAPSDTALTAQTSDDTIAQMMDDITAQTSDEVCPGCNEALCQCIT